MKKTKKTKKTVQAAKSYLAARKKENVRKNAKTLMVFALRCRG